MKKFATILTALVATAGMVLAGTPSYAADVEPMDIEVIGGAGSLGGPGYQPAGGWAAPSPEVLYPASVPDGYTAFNSHSELFRAKILPDGGEILLYCVEIDVARGDDYSAVDQDLADIGNAGYVARIVHDYYPATALPTEFGPGPIANQQRAIAVQAAIWYFTDGFVLAPDDDYYDAVAGIVAEAQAEGPMPDTNNDPDLAFALTGPAGPFEAGTLAGPFVADAALRIERYTINAGGATMYGDAEGTQVIPADTAITPDQKIWVKSDAAGAITLTANATVDAASGIFFTGPEDPISGFPQILVGAAQRYLVSATATAQFVTTPTPTPTTPTPSHGPQLADTGSDVSPLSPFLGLGALFLLAGAAALIIARKSGERSRA